MRRGCLIQLVIIGCMGLFLSGTGFSDALSSYLQETLVEAEQGNADAQLDVSINYHDGIGTPINYTESIKWITKAAEQGHDFAQRTLGGYYYNGDGVLQDYKAIEWYKKTAVQRAAIELLFEY